MKNIDYLIVLRVAQNENPLAVIPPHGGYQDLMAGIGYNGAVVFCGRLIDSATRHD
jgi:hypothetical protein